MDKFEKLVKEIMKEAAQDGEPVTEEEAAEMAKMELGAKECGRRYEGDTTKRKPAQREKKIDPEKVAILESVAHQLTRYVGESANDFTGAENIHIVNPQKEITFSVGENEYSLTLTRHRKPKGG